MQTEANLNLKTEREFYKVFLAIKGHPSSKMCQNSSLSSTSASHMTCLDFQL